DRRRRGRVAEPGTQPTGEPAQIIAEKLPPDANHLLQAALSQVIVNDPPYRAPARAPCRPLSLTDRFERHVVVSPRAESATCTAEVLAQPHDPFCGRRRQDHRQKLLQAARD